MSLYVPVIQTKYMRPRMLDDKAMGEMTAAGVFNSGSLQITAQGGDYVNMPTWVRPANLVHQTIGSTQAANFVTVDAKNRKAVVLRDYSGNQWYHSQILQIQGNQTAIDSIEQSMSVMFAQRVSKRMAQQALTNADACLQDASLKHSLDASTKTMTLDTLLNTKFLLSDYSDEIKTMVIHPNVYRDLITDILKNHQFQANEAFARAQIREIVGIENIVITALVPIGSGSTSSVGDDQYSTLLLGNDSIELGWQEEANTETTDSSGPGITNQDTVHYMKAIMSYAVQLKGYAWNSTANPTDANFATAGNYLAAWEDHRDVMAARCISLATKVA